MKTILTIIFSVVFIAIGCDTVEDPNISLEVNKLSKSWLNSFEEQVDSVQVYRPEGSKEFPTASFRKKYFFKVTGKCDLTDTTLSESGIINGNWSLQSDNVLLIYDADYKLAEILQVYQLEDDILRFTILYKREKK
ncbi:MAG: hypothetical protein HXY49_01805 [Ignavibacteriaceae bacterium]|nr:hypothetical protein [Ignavibacteriaceae bacterium]